MNVIFCVLCFPSSHEFLPKSSLPPAPRHTLKYQSHRELQKSVTELGVIFEEFLKIIF